MRDGDDKRARPLCFKVLDVRAMRAEVEALAGDVLQFDLLAKRAALSGTEGDEVAAVRVADVKARVVELRRIVALHGASLLELARNGRPR